MSGRRKPEVKKRKKKPLGCYRSQQESHLTDVRNSGQAGRKAGESDEECRGTRQTGEIMALPVILQSRMKKHIHLLNSVPLDDSLEQRRLSLKR